MRETDSRRAASLKNQADRMQSPGAAQAEPLPPRMDVNSAPSSVCEEAEKEGRSLDLQELEAGTDVSIGLCKRLNVQTCGTPGL